MIYSLYFAVSLLKIEGVDTRRSNERDTLTANAFENCDTGYKMRTKIKRRHA